MTLNFNIKVLVAPLDWGLGHATRCVPIIRYLIHKGCTVLIAAEGLQKELLEQEFPAVKILPLAGYRVSYAKDKRLLPLKIIQQLPTIIRSINGEHKWLKRVVNEHKICAVISDNRYGLYNYNIHSIFITHQLKVKAPFKILEDLIRLLSFRCIERFNECWIPDEKGSHNIAGDLSNATHLPNIKTTYLGGLSRFENSASTLHLKYKFVAVISGPEPQRTLLEEKILAGLSTLEVPGLLVRGLPGSASSIPAFNKITVVNHLSAGELQQAFLESEVVISRSGYTTVMDILKLRKKSILIPTPGQTEQEYLAVHLQKQGWAMASSQKDFDVVECLEAAAHFKYNLPNLQMDGYKIVLDAFINSIQSKV